MNSIELVNFCEFTYTIILTLWLTLPHFYSYFPYFSLLFGTAYILKELNIRPDTGYIKGEMSGPLTHTICPRSLASYYRVSFNTKLVMIFLGIQYHPQIKDSPQVICSKTYGTYTTVCPGSSDPFYIVTYYIKRVTRW